MRRLHRIYANACRETPTLQPISGIRSRHPQTMRRSRCMQNRNLRIVTGFSRRGALCRIDAKDASVWCVPAARVSIPPHDTPRAARSWHMRPRLRLRMRLVMRLPYVWLLLPANFVLLVAWLARRTRTRTRLRLGSGRVPRRCTLVCLATGRATAAHMLARMRLVMRLPYVWLLLPANFVLLVAWLARRTRTRTRLRLGSGRVPRRCTLVCLATGRATAPHMLALSSAFCAGVVPKRAWPWDPKKGAPAVRNLFVHLLPAAAAAAASTAAPADANRTRRC